MKSGSTFNAIMLSRLLAALIALLFAAAAPSFSAEKLKVVASFSILGDFVARVGGDRIEIKTIVGSDGDAHVYEPRPQDAQSMAAARTVFVNGLGYEGWIERLVEASGYKGPVVTLSQGVVATEADPHAWQNAANAGLYAENIAMALCNADSLGCETYKANAVGYIKDLQALDAEIKAAIATVPQDRRTVITSHDAFGYYARAYGVTFLAPEGISTESEASARDVAKLITQIREHKAAAVFVESISDPRLIEQIARETGLTPGGVLYSDSLSPPGGPAPDYIAMMRHNTRLLVEAMGKVAP